MRETELRSIRIMRVRTTTLLCLTAFISAWTSSGAEEGPASHAETPPPIPVVLISCDTTRADHFSCYGYARETTPYLDAWLDEVVLFENAVTEETWTLPAHATMMTGVHPNRHGATGNTNLAASIPTLAEILREAGYRTGGFTSSRNWFLPWRGLGRGFEVYDIPSVEEEVRDVFTTYKRVTAWMEQQDTSAMFLFFHNVDMHARPSSTTFRFPYGPEFPSYLHFSKGLGDRPKLYQEGTPPTYGWGFLSLVNYKKVTLSAYQQEYLRALYDDSIRSVDSAIHDLFVEMKALGIYDDALIIVTADHGETLHDRGKFGHGTVFEECAHIPMLIRFPGGRFGGTRYTELVQLSDLLPTIREVIGLPADDSLDGKSLVGMLEGRTSPRTWAYTQRFDQQAVRNTDWKLLRNLIDNSYRLFHLASDPGERHDGFAEVPPILSDLLREMDRFYTPSPAGWHVRIDSPNTGKSRTLSLRTDGEIERVRLVRGDRNNDTKTLTVDTVGVEVDWSAIRDDEVILTTEQSAASLVLGVDCPGEFVVYKGSERIDARDSFECLLDPTSASMAESQNAAQSPADRPTLYVWYVEAEAPTTPARELSPEEVEALRALGYAE